MPLTAEPAATSASTAPLASCAPPRGIDVEATVRVPVSASVESSLRTLSPAESALKTRAPSPWAGASATIPAGPPVAKTGQLFPKASHPATARVPEPERPTNPDVCGSTCVSAAWKLPLRVPTSLNSDHCVAPPFAATMPCPSVVARLQASLGELVATSKVKAEVAGAGITPSQSALGPASGAPASTAGGGVPPVPASEPPPPACPPPHANAERTIDQPTQRMLAPKQGEPVHGREVGPGRDTSWRSLDGRSRKAASTREAFPGVLSRRFL